MPRILVVDDSLFARLNICGMLEEAGHETLHATNGREGLEKILTEKPDCVFTDLLMPEMDGVELLAALQERKVNLPVIVLSADIQESKRQKCLSLGSRGFISKPPVKEALLEAIEKALGAGKGDR